MSSKERLVAEAVARTLGTVSYSSETAGLGTWTARAWLDLRIAGHGSGSTKAKAEERAARAALRKVAPRKA